MAKASTNQSYQIQLQFGLNGSQTVTGPAVVTGNFYAIMALFNDALINSVVMGNKHLGESAWANQTLPAHAPIDGVRLTTVDIASGTVILYNLPEALTRT